MAAISNSMIKLDWITTEDQLSAIDLHCSRIEKAAQTAFLGPLTYWHKALKDLKALSKTVPPLPLEKAEFSDPEFLNAHFLVLITEELGDLNKLNDRVKAYGKSLDNRAGAHPFKFEKFNQFIQHPSFCERPFKSTRWVWITKDIVPNSRGELYPKQESLIKDLAKNTGRNYEVPLLDEIVAAVLLYKIATGENLYSIKKSEDLSYHERIERAFCTFTRVQEEIEVPGFPKRSAHLMVGGFSENGLLVGDDNGENDNRTGIGAVWRM